MIAQVAAAVELFEVGERFFVLANVQVQIAVENLAGLPVVDNQVHLKPFRTIRGPVVLSTSSARMPPRQGKRLAAESRKVALFQPCAGTVMVQMGLFHRHRLPEMRRVPLRLNSRERWRTYRRGHPAPFSGA